MKLLTSKDFKKTMAELEKFSKEMQVTLEILKEDAKLYSGIFMENGKVSINEENDRRNYYKFMEEVLERLDRIEKKLDELGARE